MNETMLRVPQHTADQVNREIRRQTIENIAEHAAGGPEAIDARLRELDREWDIDRALEANASALALSGVLLGATVSRKWLALPVLVTGFLLQHAIQGWCPPVPFFRKRGFRTTAEIDYERYALKALRGDFRELPPFTEGRDRAAAAVLLQTVCR